MALGPGQRVQRAADETKAFIERLQDGGAEAKSEVVAPGRRFVTLTNRRPVVS